MTKKRRVKPKSKPTPGGGRPRPYPKPTSGGGRPRSRTRKY